MQSPRTLFQVEALYTRFPVAPQRFCFDKGCNVHSYIVNREPRHLSQWRCTSMRHTGKGTTIVPVAYNTGELSKHQTSFKEAQPFSLDLPQCSQSPNDRAKCP